MIKTRFAPSPTGYMHIGNLRTALYSYLISKHENGKFVLRIEDTDRERFVEGATDIIKNIFEISFPRVFSIRSAIRYPTKTVNIIKNTYFGSPHP